LRDFTLPGAHALVGNFSSELSKLNEAPARPVEQGRAIAIEVAEGARLLALQPDWLDLLARADCANIFMNPSLVALAASSYPGLRCCALLAWQNTGAGSRLAGIWAFSIGRAPHSILPLAVLAAPAMPHAYLGTPVIDSACPEAVLGAMLDYISGDANLPKIVAVTSMSAANATMEALNRVLAARRGALRIFAQIQRPVLSSELDGKTYLERALSSSSRKKLRQHRRRLAEKGALASSIFTDAEDVRRAFEDFLALEASGWKGRSRTALLSKSADTTFTRGMIGTLAARGEAFIHALTLDGRPVSMQIVLQAGSTAFTWKTAYDESLGDFSPGMLLLEDYTAAFLANGAIARVDSCSLDDTGYMAAWTERASIAQLWFDAGPGRSRFFALLSELHASFLKLRACAKEAYHARLRRRKAIEAKSRNAAGKEK